MNLDALSTKEADLLRIGIQMGIGYARLVALEYSLDDDSVDYQNCATDIVSSLREVWVSDVLDGRNWEYRRHVPSDFKVRVGKLTDWSPMQYCGTEFGLFETRTDATEPK